LVYEAFGTCERSARGKSRVASYAMIPEVCLQDGPIDGAAGRFLHVFIVHIPCDSDDFAPIICAVNAHALPQRSSGRAPVITSQIFRDQCDRNFAVCICPAKITPCDQAYTQRMQIVRRDEYKMSKRRKCALRVCTVRSENII